VIVISDTSPISNFFKINQLLILQKVYDTLIIPAEVYEELKELSNFGLNPDEIFYQPWIEIKSTFLTPFFFAPEEKIHLGEAAAISLAMELQADYILIDDRKGQLLAIKHRLNPIGTLGTLKIAKEKGIIAEVKDVLGQMISDANYWLSKELYTEFLKNCNEL